YFSVAFQIRLELSLAFQLTHLGDQEVLHIGGAVFEVFVKAAPVAAAHLGQSKLRRDWPQAQVPAAVVIEQIAIAVYQADGVAIVGDGGADTLPIFWLAAEISAEEGRAEDPYRVHQHASHHYEGQRLPDARLAAQLLNE